MFGWFVFPFGLCLRDFPGDCLIWVSGWAGCAPIVYLVRVSDGSTCLDDGPIVLLVHVSG